MIQYDTRVIGLINIFENVTKAKVKDCFEEEDTLVFIVQEGQVKRAVGPGGQNIRKLSAMMKRKIKVIEFSGDVERFVINLLYPLRPRTQLRDGALVLKAADSREKGQIFGREKTNLKRIQGIVSKYYKLEIKVE